VRERDVRNAIRDAVSRTGHFDGVYLSGLPEDYGFGASSTAVAVIEPDATNHVAGWDSQIEGGLDFRASVKLTLIARDRDGQARDEAAELLLDVAVNAIQGVSLAGFTVPGRTMDVAWRWLRPAAPERRIVVSIAYDYLVEGWNSFDVSE
jgi:hypothetical protein